MKRFVLLFLFWLVVALIVRGQDAKYRHARDGALLPDPKATPGATLDVSLKTLCATGYPATVRNVNESTKKAVYAEYGATSVADVCCEVDHLISLELGGSNDIANLWPQPYKPRPGAHEKDTVENYLHRSVCSGAMSLLDAQSKISKDWTVFLPEKFVK